MTTFKEYNKLMKSLNRDEDFEVIKTTSRTTVKLVHIESGLKYSIHPGDNAVKPLKKWVKQFKK